MTNKTFRTNYYPISKKGIDLTFIEIEYEILEQSDNLITAKFVEIHPKMDGVDSIPYTLPTHFKIDTKEKLLLDLEGKPFAKTTVIK